PGPALQRTRLPSDSVSDPGAGRVRRRSIDRRQSVDCSWVSGGSGRRRALGRAVGLFGLLAVPSARAADTWALLVGISKYQSPRIASLHFPAADAAGIREAL